MREQEKKAFSLVEMLVVVLVIGILSGILFKLYGVATRTAVKSQTIAKLEKIAFALEEYKAEYGIYPPVTSIKYDVGPQGTTDPFLKELLNKPKTLWDVTGDNVPDIDDIFIYGLVSYLWLRNDSQQGAVGAVKNFTGQGTGWIADTPRDVAAKKRWYKYIKDLNNGQNPEEMLIGIGVTNVMATIKDGWGKEIVYGSTAPYQTYELWSLGPDGAANTPDDIHKDKWDN